MNETEARYMTVDARLWEHYKRERAKGTDAVAAAQSARWRLTEPELPFGPFDDMWKVDVTRDGFDVKVRVDYDYDSSRADWMGTLTDDARGEVERNPRAWYLRDASCGSYHQVDATHPEWMRLDDHYAYIAFADGYRRSDHYAWARSAGMSRAVARDYAAECVARDVELLTADNQAIVYIVVRAYRAGIELGSASLSGIDLSEDDDAANARWLSEYALDLIEEAVSAAEDALARLCEVSA